MTETPENNPTTDVTPPDPSTASAPEFAPTEPVAATPPAVGAGYVPSDVPPDGPPLGPPSGPPVSTGPTPLPTPNGGDSKRSWWKKGLIGVAALALVGLIFSAGVVAGFVGGRFDRFDRRDRMSDRMEEVFGQDSSPSSRRDRIQECFFEDGANRPEDCPPFSRRGGSDGSSSGDSGWGGPWDEGAIFDDDAPALPVPVPPRSPRDSGASDPTGAGRSDGPDQAVIVYPDGRVVPLEPNTAPAPTAVPPPATAPVPGP